MFSKRAKGYTFHDRLGHPRHRFMEPISYYLFDLAELTELSEQSRFFSFNRGNLLAINECDYLGWEAGTLRDRLIAACCKEQANFQAGRIELLTMPKVLGYAFIPVSFYFCYDQSEELAFFALEINNTFAERHFYLLPVKSAQRNERGYSWKIRKDFHVSPFWSMDYDYQIHLERAEGSLRIDVNLERSTAQKFISYIQVELTPIDFNRLSLKLVADMFRIVLAMPKIMWHALILSIVKRLPVHMKPNPASANTIRASMYSWFDQFCYKIITTRLKNIANGVLVLTLPDGRELRFDGAEPGQQVNIKLNNFRLFRRVVLKGAIGFGESYSDGDWDCSDPAAAISFLLNNYHAVSEHKLNLIKPMRWLERLRHSFRSNTLKNSPNNIAAHYDLSNDFFATFLDRSRMYSAAYYTSPDQSLELAQREKIKMIATKAGMQPGAKILEIGSGWGGFAEYCAEEYSAQVTSLTLSKEQKQYAQEQARKKGLAAAISYELLDYRNAQGEYDHIVSIEMLEAVGHGNLEKFFRKCNQLLKPSGSLVAQVIAYPDTHYSSYLKSSDWIQKHIFPGSHLPSLGALLAAAAKAGLIIENVENLAEHYARTLCEWRQRFELNLAAVRQQGFDEKFIRTWRFYLAACEAEFATRWLAVYQIVFTRPNNSKLSTASKVYKLEQVA